MNIYYFTSGPRERVLKKIVDEKHCVKAVFVTNPDRWGKVGETVSLAEKLRIPVHVVKKEELEMVGERLKEQIIFSAGFAYIFPKQFLEVTDLCLNVHGTLLPHYGGARTLNWIIENGEEFSGVTVHEIDEGVDTGPILIQEKFSISKFDTGNSLYRKTLEFEPEVVAKALKMLGEAASPIYMEQSSNGIKTYPNRIPRHSELNPDESLNSLYNKIRASDPINYPAYFFVDGQKVCIKLWRPNKKNNECDMV